MQEHTIPYGVENVRNTIPYSARDTITYQGVVRNTVPYSVRDTITYQGAARNTVPYSTGAVRSARTARRGRPRDRDRERPRSGKLVYYFANVTAWTQKAQEYLNTAGSPFALADVVAVAEHHRKGDGLTTAIKQLHKQGWRVSAEASVETGVATLREGQGHGGVRVQSRAHLQQKGLTKEAKAAVQLDEYMGLGTQWMARTIRMKGHDVVFAVIYLAPGEGLRGCNYVTLQEVGAYLRAVGSPFVLAGDFNMVLEDLLPFGLHTFLSAEWRSPPGDVPGGQRGIDLMLLSRPLAATAVLHWDYGGPWAQPHTGMWVELDVSGFSQTITIYRAPPEIVMAAGPDLPWEQHEVMSRNAAIEGARRLRERTTCERSAFQNEQVDTAYINFMTTAEHLLVHRQPDVNFHDATIHRGWPLEVKEVTLQPPRPTGWLAKPSGLAAWAALSVRFQCYIAAVAKGGAQVEAERARTREQLHKVQGLSRILDKGVVEAQVLDLVLHFTTGGSLDLGAAKDFHRKSMKPLLHQLEAHLLRVRTREFRSWIGNPLKVGAGGLHKYTKSWDQVPPRLATEAIEHGKDTVGVQELNKVKAYGASGWLSELTYAVLLSEYGA